MVWESGLELVWASEIRTVSVYGLLLAWDSVQLFHGASETESALELSAIRQAE